MKCFYKYLFSVFILFSSLISAQVENNSGEVKKLDSFSRFMLTSPFVVENNLYLSPIKFNIIPNSDFNSNAIRQGFLSVKENIALTYNLIKELQEKRSLGTIGKVLGIASTAATFGLAAYHLTKYSSHYRLR